MSAVRECVIATGGPGVLFHSQHCALLFTVTESPALSPSLSLPFPSHPLCCCCEHLFAFSVDSPLCLFVFDLVFVFYLIFYSLFALRLVRTLPLSLPRFLTSLLDASSRGVVRIADFIPLLPPLHHSVSFFSTPWD